MKARNNYRLKLMANLCHGKVLDIGFAKQPNPFLKDAVGLDIKKAKKPKNYTKVHIGNSKKLKFKNRSFDGILAGYVIEYIPEIHTFFSECNRVLKLHGKLIIASPNCYYIPEILLQFFVKKDFSPLDLMVFPPKALERNLKMHGFKLIKKHATGFNIPLINKEVRLKRFPLLSRIIVHEFVKNGKN